MIARIWKKVGFFVLIIACIFNIMIKLVNKTPFLSELRNSAQYVMFKSNEKK